MIFDTVLFRTTLIPAQLGVAGCWSWFPGLLASAGRPAPAPVSGGDAGFQSLPGRAAYRSERDHC